MPVQSDDELRAILEKNRVAVIGCSTSPGKAAHDVPQYLLDNGYDVVPVNPFADEIFGIEAYDAITDVPGEIDIVDVFRPSDEAPQIVDAVLERDDTPVIWLQEGITHDEALANAEEAGHTTVQDRCMKKEYQRLLD